MQQWMVATKRADFKGIGERFGIDQVTARVLRNRGLTEDDEIRRFLDGGMEDLYDPHLLLDGDKLACVLEEKIRAGAKIRVIGDYDIDGVMSSYIFYTGLMRCGADVSVAIPHRITDGYGLNVHLIDEAYDDGIDVILTCDNGIAAIDEIAHAKELGMTVLVTDHHEVPYDEIDGERHYRKSEADATVNPHQPDCPYPCKVLCGAAVAWKIIVLLYEKMGIPAMEAEDFLEDVAFATVGDIVPLIDENRILVKEGLSRIKNTKNIGMRALIKQCSLSPESINAYHFGFVLGPCINAAGRLDTAQRALSLFTENDRAKADGIAVELAALNAERKDMTEQGV
ncbi:MAG: DHH family phosphoesterase, partial [Clostridiales bacterium]|nr:DHH family phosphoesterase [Clostridiales bacterium]